MPFLKWLAVRQQRGCQDACIFNPPISKHSGLPYHYALQIPGSTVADGHGMWLSLGSADSGLGQGWSQWGPNNKTPGRSRSRRHSDSLSWFSTSDLVMQSVEPGTLFLPALKAIFFLFIPIMLCTAIFKLMGLNIKCWLVVFSVCM